MLALSAVGWRDRGAEKIYTPRAKKREEDTVTVCVAAICDDDTIFGASDRKITAGDIEFEPEAVKIDRITQSVAVMAAGDSAIHAEILQSVHADVQDQDWLWDVKEIAELYSQYYNTLRQKGAERAFLAPFGLTMDAFIGRQGDMSPEWVKQVGYEIINYNPGNVEAIVAGVDEMGAHIWVVENEMVSCHDNEGYAAVGIGRAHAKSQFMFSGHTRRNYLPETLLLTYTAKKRAEAAPGVGTATDMFIVGPTRGTFDYLHEGVLAKLEAIYKTVRRKEKNIVKKAEEGGELLCRRNHEAAKNRGCESRGCKSRRCSRTGGAPRGRWGTFIL